jgi:hypothetical protein
MAPRTTPKLKLSRAPFAGYDLAAIRDLFGRFSL